MRVCLVTSQRPFEGSVGGEQKFTVSLGQWLEYKGHDVVVVGRNLLWVKDAQPTQIANDCSHHTPVAVEPPIAFQVPYLLDVVGALFFSFILSLKILYVNHKERLSLIHAQDSYAGLAGLFTSRLLKIPFIIHIHGLRVNTMDKNLKGLLRLMLPYERLLDIFVSNNADATITVNSKCGEYLEQNGVASEKIRAIPVGVDTNNFGSACINRNIAREELGVKSDIALGFIGRFSPEKNIVTLLDAFSAAIDQGLKMKLVLVGTGPLHDELKEICCKKHLEEKVIFTGVRTDVSWICSGLDVFILPSYTEGCPTSILEAMAAGKAIIASDIPAVREIAECGKDVLVFDPCSVQELTDSIRFLYRSPKLRKALGENARKRASQYDINVIFLKILQVYMQVCSSR